MNKQLRIRIGTQSAFTAVPFLAPFYYAAEHGFDAFEWLPDMKDSGAGWLEKDVDPRTRLFIKETSAEYDIRLSVHAPWHLNLANPDHRIRLAETLEFARQIGATLLNVHLFNEHKPNAYIEGVLSLTDFLVDNDMILSIENTPYTAPHDFNAFFKHLKQIAPNALSCVGMCLDIGHANLCAATRNDYLGFIDTLATEVPIIHVHLHENYGDFDSHLTVFTGPAQKDGRGIEGLIKRLKRRSFCGSIILEQWPDPPSQLDEARDRLQAMLYGDPSSAAEGAFPEKNSTEKNLDEDTFLTYHAKASFFGKNGVKIILVLLDGLGDRAYARLGHRTPLQAAITPNLDRLASLGSNGLFHASVVGQCLPSEAAHYLLFGYDLKEFPGRGLLEAVGLGLDFEDGDVLSLSHLSEVVVEQDTLVLRHGPEVFHGDVADIEALLEPLTPCDMMGVRFRLHKKPFINDAILVMSGDVSPYVSDSDPIIPGRKMARVVPLSEGVHLGSSSPESARHTADVLNAFLARCHALLENHEVNRRRSEQNRPRANFLTTQRCGQRIEQEPFKSRWGLSSMLVASQSVYGGIAHELGMTFRQVKDKNDAGGDLRERIRIALEDRDHDFFHVHTKMPDQAAHTGNPEWKTEVITSLDRGLGELIDAVSNRNDLLVAVTADHSTPSRSDLIHSGEPVPVVLAGTSVRRDVVQSFDEIHAAMGCLGALRGKELMLMLLNYADRSAFFSHHLGPGEKAWVPDDYEPFLSRPFEKK